MPTPNRYYYIINNKQMGPNTAEDMSEAIRAGVFTAATLVCLEGGSQWIPLSRYAELSAYLPEEAKRPRRVKVNAVPPAKPTPPADPLAKPALPAQALGMPKTPATPAAPKPPLRDRLARLLPGFNVNSVLLLLVIALLAVMVGKPEPGVKPSRKDPAYPAPPAASAPEYEYWAYHIDREELALLHEIQSQNKDSRFANDIPAGTMSMQGHVSMGSKWDERWEYVGHLCNDGMNGAWILIRRPKYN